MAITRAKRGLVVLGDGSVLKTCRHWAALLNSCHERGCSLTESEYYCAVEIEEEEKRVRKELAVFELDKEDEYFGLFYRLHCVETMIIYLSVFSQEKPLI